MESRFCTYRRVGYLKQSVANKLVIEFSGVVYASPGVFNHILKRHKKQFDKKDRDCILKWMKDIIDNPDYVGFYKGACRESAIQFVKKIYMNILLGIDVDFENGYIYVSTMYPVTDMKVISKVYRGELISLN